MTVVSIVEICVVALLVIVHILSNFYGARCSCKLCKSVRALYDMISLESSQPISADEMQKQKKELLAELDNLSKSLAEFYENGRND